MIPQPIMTWLLKGDPSIQYQTRRDLLGEDRKDLRNQISSKGWGARYLAKRQANGHWGAGFYQPKWTCTHYTLLELRNLCLAPHHPLVKQTLKLIFDTEKNADGGIGPQNAYQASDVCINGMALNYAAYFQVEESRLKPLVDFILAQAMADGGFNCRSNGPGATHSSLHTSLSVLEGITAYKQNGYRYRLKELLEARNSAQEFILLHRFFRSHRTGRVIRSSFLRLSYPCRWYYDILRALDHFRQDGRAYDPRMGEAIDILLKKRNSRGLWLLPAAHPGKCHFTMEPSGKASRWNTLRALRVLKHFAQEI